MAWKHTADHSDQFYASMAAIARELECPLIDLFGAANAESGVWAKARNPSSSATGILQWMAMHWSAWGFTRDQFAALPADVQVKYVLRYLAPFKGKLPNAAAIYTAIFLPAYVPHAGNLDYVLCAQEGKLPAIYAANASFDANRDGRITVGDLLVAIQRNWVGPRCMEMRMRADLQFVEAGWLRPPMPHDLSTWLGVQLRLIALGYDLGESGADNVPGAKTRLAVAAFQRLHGLVADGVVGVKTRAALAVG